MSRLAALLPLLALLLVPAACAPKRTPDAWMKPGVSQDRANEIEAECRSIARSKVERNYRLDELTERQHDVAGDAVLTQRLDRYDARAEIRRLVANCMREHGFRPVESDRPR